MMADKNMETTELYDFIVTINDGFCTYEYTLSSSGDYSIYDVLKSITNTIKLRVKQEKFIPQTKDVTSESDVMELVNKLRLGGFALNSNDPEDHGPNGDDYYFEIATTEAAALIEAHDAAIHADERQKAAERAGKKYMEVRENGDTGDVIDAVISAIMADTEPASPWISVKERLPEENKHVLIYSAKTIIEAAFYDGDWSIYEGDWITGRHVTHWMPLPSPPAIMADPQTVDDDWTEMAEPEEPHA